MNKTFHSIWNASKQAWVAAAETVSAKGKPTSGAKVAAVISALFGGLLTLSAHAQTAPPPNTLPTGGQLSAGQAAISQSGANMVITQSTDRAAINWQSFNVGKDAHVQFQQPGAGSVTLNRVLSADPSQIFGRITANGQVILTNPSGVYFGPSARVDVGGLVATTMDMNDADFMAGNNRYQRNGSTGNVVNEGELKAALGGYIALLAPEVRNQGAVIAQMGTVALASGEAVDLRFDSNNRLTSLRVEPSQIQALVDNQHAVQAPGGLIIISAQSMDRLVGGVVKNSGNLEANSLIAKGGRIVLEGDHIELQSTSRIDASGATGGGTVLVGGDWQGSGDMHQATTVSMAAGAVIDASATQQGDGGKVVLWSNVGNADSVTSAGGTVLAKGGAQGGNGGQVETSGHSVDTANLSVNAGAERGTGGLWLIDPYDYTISSASSINTSLNNGTSVTIDTANPSSGSYSGSGGSGTITVSDNIAKTIGAAATLTLNASSAISGTGSISSSGNALGVMFNAGGSTGLYSGLISGNVSLTKSGAGNLSLMNANTYTGGTTLSAGTLGVYTNTAMGAGALTVSGNSSLLLGRGVTSIANNLTLNATLSVSYDTHVDYLMVGGGGGGGSRAGGGGGAGGFVSGSSTVGSGSYSVWVGAGGSGQTTSTAASNGGDSSLGFVSTTAYGGGAGGGQSTTVAPFTAAANGGSGGGSQYYAFAAGTGVAGQGNAGGTGAYTDGYEQSWAGGGGGGAGGVGSVGWSTYSNGNSGNGGAGLSSNITGATVYYAGGGGGGLNQHSGGTLGLGGIGGGGNGSKSAAAANGVANTGGGGGGGGFSNWLNQSYAGGSGGSGVVIARYLGASAGTGGTVSAGTGTATGYTLQTFTATGSSTLSLDALATTFSGNISGTGGLTVNGGSGSQITLTGNNSNTGTTTVSSGTLQVGSGGTSGTLSAGAVVNNAALVFNRSGALTVAGVISGSGTVTQAGSGTTTLTGNNSYSGTTAINAGTLQVGTGGTSGTLGTGAVTDTAALVFNRSDALTVSAAISGSGSVTQAGSGTTTLTANNTYTSATTISGGTLVLQNNAPNPSNKTFNGNGALRIEPGSPSFNSAFSTSGWTFASTLSGLTLGKSGNTRDLTIANTTSIAGPISLYGGNITLNAGLTATGSNTITLAGSGTVTDGSSGFVSADKLALTGSGNYTLDSTSNAIDTLAASGVSGLTYVDSNALTIGTVGSTNGVSATGAVNIGTTSGDLTVAQNVVTSNTGTTALVLNAGMNTAAGTASGGNVLLTSGANLGVPSGGRAVIYTGGISGSTGYSTQSDLVSGSGHFRYGSDEAATVFTTALGTGLYAVYRERPSGSVTVGNQSITYGDSLTSISGTLTGSPVNGDVAIYSVTNGMYATSGSIRVGSYTLTETGLSGLGYNVTASNGTLTVAAKALSLTGLLAANKVYDGNATATISNYGSLSGKVTVGANTDAVSLVSSAASASFTAGKNVGSNLAVSVSGLALNGADAGNYSIATQATTAIITPKSLTLTAATDSKVYDGNTTSSGTVSYSGLVTGDTLSGLTQSYDNKNVQGTNGSTLSVNSGYTLSDGNSGNNYAVIGVTATGTITSKALTLSGATGISKTYDGTTSTSGVVLDGTSTAAAAMGSLGGVISGDTVTTTGAPVFAGANVARVGSVVSGAVTTQAIQQGTVVLSGADAGNYSLSWANGTGTINPAALTVTANNDAKFVTMADPSFAVSYSGFVNGESSSVLSSTPTVSVDRSSTLNITNGSVSTGRLAASGSEAAGTYASALVASGAAAYNYSISYVKGSYTIVPADQLLVRVNSASTTYGTDASYSLSSVKYVGTTGQATFTVSSLGANGLITGLTITNGANKFVVGDQLSLSGGSGNSAQAFVTSVSNGVITGVNISNGGAFYAPGDVVTAQYTREVSVGSTVTGSSVALDDSAGTTASFGLTPQNAVNSTAGKLKVGAYQLGGASLSVTGSNFSGMTVVGDLTVNQKALTAVVNTGAKAKTYDGTAAMLGLNLDATAAGAVTNDLVSLSGSGAFSNKNVSRDGSNALAANKSYTVSGISLSGADANNYYLSSTSVTGSDGQITPKTLTVGYTGVDKVYDGGTAATVTTSDNRITGDNLSIARTADFVSTGSEAAKSVVRDGNGVVVAKNISVSSVSLSGTDALNYALASTTGSATAKITPASLVISGIVGVDKTYDKTTDAVLGTSGLLKTGLVNGDVVNVAATGAYADYNAGLSKAITLSSTYSGADVGNYTITNQTGTTASIDKRQVSVSASGGITKTYDGTTAMTGVAIGLAAVNGVASSGVVTGDTVAVSGTGSFNSADVSRDSQGNVLSDKSYTLDNLSLSGSSATNYMIVGGVTSLSGSNGTINPRTVTLTASKIYDGGTTLTGDQVTIGNLVTGQTLDFSGATTSDAHVATTGKYMTAITLLDGSTGLASNYQLPTLNATNAAVSISAKALMSTASITAAAKTYDGTTAATGSTLSGSVSGAISGDSISLNTSGFTLAFSDAHVATANKTIGVASGGAGFTIDSSTSSSQSTDYSFTGPTLSAVPGTINAATLTPTLTNTGVNKVYDGSTDAPGGFVPSWSLSGLVSGDTTASLSNTGMAYDSKNVATASKVTVSGLSITFITGSNSSTTTDYVLDATSKDVVASITRKALNVSYAGSNKVYDGNVNATVSAGDDRISGDVLAVSQTSAVFADKNVGAGKNISISGIVLTGADAGNYSWSTSASTTASITRLNSVSWIGGSTGNWFDPANWAGGAVPDLSNVANVVIPAGVVVSFNTAGAVAPADASQAVNVDSLGTSGSLSQTDGTLNVGTGGITLDALSITGGTLTNTGATHLNTYNQSGGSFSGTGNFNVNGFTQTGGSAVLQGDFTVNQNYSQSGSGSVTVGGNTSITDTSGGVVIGNLNTAGTTQITSTGGDITQAAGTAVVSGGAATLGASNSGAAADITLNGANNDFQAVVNANGANVSLTDVNALTLGTVTTAGNLAVNSHGALDLGTSTVGGNLNANSGNGNITQSGPLNVTGTSNLTAGTGDMTLTNPANDFTGTVSASGSNVSITDANALTLGTVTTTGNLTGNSHGALDMGTSAVGGNLNANSGNGNITQAGPLSVTGTSNLAAGMGNIALTHPANNFVGVVSASGAHVSLTDANALTLGAVNSTGNLNVRSGGALNLGGGMVGGALVATSNNNPITQSGALHVAGLAEFDAGISTVMLTHAGNEFSAGTQVTASNSLIVGDARKQAGDAEARAQSNQPVRALDGTALANGNASQPLVLTSATASSSESGSSGATGFASANSAGVTLDVQSVSQQEMPTMVAVSLPKGASTVGVGFSFELPESVKSAMQNTSGAQASLPSGAMLPLWLRFDAQTLRFEATAVPDGAFPMQVAVTAGGQQMLVVISERME